MRVLPSPPCFPSRELVHETHGQNRCLRRHRALRPALRRQRRLLRDRDHLGVFRNHAHRRYDHSSASHPEPSRRRLSRTWHSRLCVHHFQPTFFGWISFAGISSLATMGIESVWTEGGQRKTHLLAFVPSLLFVTSEYFADNMLRWAATVLDKVYDLYLYAFDASLHVQIPFAVGRYFAQHSALRQVSLLAYIGLSVPIAVVYAGQVRRTGAKALQCFFTFVITGPMGILFYNAVPALGPAHLFNKNFPWHPLAIDQVRRLFLEPIALDGPRNAIPSLHMAWVLLAWWYSRGLSKMERAVALFYLVFVALATLGTGEHYFVDLVVAVPFALFMESLFAYDLPLSDSNRVRGVACGLLSTCAWLAALRFTPHIFWFTPIFPWSLCAATIAVSLYFESHLHDSGKATPQIAPLSG